jgi:hypothetical protein
MRADQRSLWVGRPTMLRLQDLQARLVQEKKRAVTMSEVIEYLLAVHALEVRP